MKKAVLSLSGGMDSSSLLLHLLANGYEVTALGFDYGQKHSVELERASLLTKYLKSKELPVTYQIVGLGGLSSLLNSSLVKGGADVPEGHYEQDNMKETVVPNRNKIFASLIQAVALSIATTGDKNEVEIAMGIHAGDHAIYPDCRQEFRDADMEAFKIGNWDSELVTVTTPYLELNKFNILEDGQRSCDILGLDFDTVYRNTNTSYKPIKVITEHKWFKKDAEGNNVGDEQTSESFSWYSDYKSAASVERIEAFIKLGRPDPVAYADETGPVTWEVAKAHVEEVLAQHSK
jgi:7-cyano-7-deazaguanine synthase